MTTALLRPGVYSDVEGSGVLYRPWGRAVGIAAPGLGESGRVYAILWERDARQIFGEESLLPALCRLALQNGAGVVKAVSAGSGAAEEYQTALAALEQEELAAVVCGGGREAQLLLKQSVERASGDRRERLGVAACEEEDRSAWAAALRGERMVLLGQRPADEEAAPLPAALLAAAAAGRVAGMTDLAAPLNGVPLLGIAGLADALSEEDVDGYLRMGVTPLEKRAGAVELIRVVTGVREGDGFQEVNLTLVTDFVLKTVRTALQDSLAGAKNTLRTREAVATQAAVALEEQRAAGLLASYSLPRVSADPEDPGVCRLSLEFAVQRGLNQIVIAARLLV